MGCFHGAKYLLLYEINGPTPSNGLWKVTQIECMAGKVLTLSAPEKVRAQTTVGGGNVGNQRCWKQGDDSNFGSFYHKHQRVKKRTLEFDGWFAIVICILYNVGIYLRIHDLQSCKYMMAWGKKCFAANSAYIREIEPIYILVKRRQCITYIYIYIHDIDTRLQ